MNLRKLPAIVGLLATSLTVSADPLWVGTYNGPFNSYDEVHAIGADDSGNVVVSGFSELSQSDAEFVTIKYRANGDTAWLRHFNPGSGLDGATALGVDGSGNAIVTGYLGGPTSEYGAWATVKYSAAGESLWAANWQYGVECRASAIALDTAGNSYITGQAGSQNYFDFAVLKYDPAGNEVWSFIYDGGDNDGANAVTVDRQGHTYATGYSIRSGNYGDLMTWELGPGGESLWASVYDGPAARHDVGTAIAVDHAGDVIVAGFSNDASNRSDYITIKYAPTGETLWTRRYNGPGNQQDYVAGLVLDAAGNAYVTGFSYADASHYNYTTIKYNPDGRERWVARYAGPRGSDQASAIALDAEANVYVTGSSLSASNSWDVVTVKYDSAGNQRWVERWDRPSVYDEGYVIALGPDSSVFVGGRTNSDSGGIDYLTLKYGAAGAVEEGRPTHGALRITPEPTLVRGVLEMPPAANRLPTIAQLLSSSGRKVLDLHPGANDITRLAPGVYFLRNQLDSRPRRVTILK